MSKKHKLQSYNKLVCGGNTVTLGIENNVGHWNMQYLEEHIKECPECSKLSLSVFSYMRKVLKGE